MNPFVGLWVANIGKSRRHVDHQFKSATITFDVSGEEVRLAHAGINASGNEECGTTVLRADGREYPVSPQSPGLVAIARWLGPHVLETEARRDGELISQGTYAVSEDGRNLIASIGGTDPTGTPFAHIIVFDRP
jgi:hypothetical protein